MAAFQNIVYVERAPTRSPSGIECAATLSSAMGARLTVAGFMGDALPSEPNTVPADTCCTSRWWRRRVDGLVKLAESRGVEARPTLISGDFVDAMKDRVRTEEHDLIILSRRTPGDPWPFRPHWSDRRLLRETAACVAFLSPGRAPSFSRVMAGVDVSSEVGRELGGTVTARALALTEALGGELNLLHAWSMIGESILASPRRGISRNRLKELRKAERERRHRLVNELLGDGSPPVPLRISLPRQAPRLALERRARAWGADMILVGRPGRSALGSLFLPTLAEHLLDRTAAAVMIITAPSRPAPEDPPVAHRQNGSDTDRPHLETAS